MYQIFGDEIYSSLDISSLLKENYDIDTITDLTKSTSREDTIALKCSVHIDRVISCDFDMTDIKRFEDLMSKSEAYIDDVITSLKIKYSLHKIRAYKYDQISQKIVFIVCIMYIESARKKINDVFKRLLKNND